MDHEHQYWMIPLPLYRLHSWILQILSRGLESHMQPDLEGALYLCVPLRQPSPQPTSPHDTRSSFRGEDDLNHAWTTA